MKNICSNKLIAALLYTNDQHENTTITFTSVALVALSNQVWPALTDQYIKASMKQVVNFK